MSGTASRSDVIIIGGGQAGVSLAYYLRQRNLSHIVLERDRPFASWRGRWDGFRANTPNWMNTLPMLGQRRMPRAEADEFASRDELVRYLDECLRVVDPPLVLGADVTSVREVEGGWEVQAGDCSYRVDNVAVCTGAMNTPRVPAAARQLPTHIRTLHSSEYVSPEQITTANVLVVGSASSGMQILRLLAETGRFGGGLHLATSRVLVLPKHVAGVPIHRVVNAFGLFDVRTRSPLGKVMYSGLETRGDPIMPPTPKQLARQYGVQLYGKLTGFDASGLRFADGQTLAPDDLTVIWCTGFRSDYAYIEPLDRSAAFDTGGFPLHVRGVVEGAPGLYFVGLRYQHTSASHDIYGVGQDARYVAEHIQRRARRTEPLAMVPVETCCVCDTADADVIARGYDFEYATSPDEFSARRCRACGNVYLNPRPDVSQFERIYPPEYHSLDFSEESYSLVHRVRSRLEANRLLRYCAGAPADARILDVGCGDAFHLKLLRRYGKPGWTLEGVDIDARAVEIAGRSGITIHQGTVEDLDLGEDRYDVVYTIQTIEHVARPDRVLAAINRVLKPGGRLVIVTDNTESVDARWFRRRYWGGYHFPRHWNLFNKGALTRLAVKSGFASERIDTIVSPVNWVYSVHNALVDKGAPQWLIDRFTLKSPIALAVFTVVDAVLQRTGRGALLNAFFTKPSR